MRAEELRIGNYVNNAFGKTIVITTINNITASGYNLQSLFPIPLTEERLLKFGFENSPENYWHKNNVAGSIIDNEFMVVWYELAPCKYVHQLQNLYFALTGKEL